MIGPGEGGRKPEARSPAQPGVEGRRDLLPPGTVGPVLLLRILSGPLKGNQAILFGTLPLVIGSGDGADLRLPDQGLAPRHLQLTNVGGKVESADLTTSSAPTLLEPGAVIRLGETDLEIAAPPSTPEPLSLRPPEVTRLGALLGKGPGMLALFDGVTAASKTTACVLIEGEPGTGKTLVAREIHRLSKRSKGPFRVVDLADVPPEHLTERLFGSEGALRSAGGGTVFLRGLSDQILLDAQARLRTLIETRVLDGTKIDFRLIASTHGRLEGPLAHRINTIHLAVPPLRERFEDLPLLAAHFLTRARSSTTFSDEDLEVLTRHPWPRNIRELEEVIEIAARVGGDPGEALAYAMVRSM